MSAINHCITEQELEEAYQAVVAIQKQKGHTESEAKETARILAFGVFRNLITFESLINSIIGNAERTFAH